MAESAMSSTIWDGEGGSHSYNPNEQSLIKDGLEYEKADDPSLHLTKHERAKQVLHAIEDLERNYSIDWLDELPLFDEIQTLAPVEEMEVEGGKIELKFQEEAGQASPDGEPGNLDARKEPPLGQDLFAMEYENSATFTLSNENILYINNQPFVTLTPFQPMENTWTVKCKEECVVPSRSSFGSEEGSFCPDLDGLDVKTEMAVVEEIVRNTVLELDQWESETSQSETSTDGTSSSGMSPSKEKDEEDEEEAEDGGTDDPEWKPESVKSSGRISGKRSKVYRRDGSKEEKNLRKKEQNRNAATRYRLKKKAEVNEILEEEKSLREKKSELEEEAADIQNEIKCMKRLLREFFREKGMIH